MKRTLSKLSAVGLALVALLTACQKEEHPGRLELTAEGMGSGAKMYVNGLASYWQTGDKVNINGAESSITASGEQAYIDGEFSTDNYCIVFPSSIYQSREGNAVTVNMPSKYQYKTQNIAGVGSKQILNAPMAYLGSAEGGKVKMMHLTGALNVQISGPSGIVIDRIVVGTTQNRVMSGPMTFDLTNLESIGSSATNASANNTIEMIGGTIGTVQIPIPVLTGNVNFTVVVEGHVEGTKYTFSRTQTTGGHLGRGVVGTVSVDLNEGQTGVTTSALFSTITIDGQTYYSINSALEFQLMASAINGTRYKEDGDWCTRDWQYNAIKYKSANYYINKDFDMENVQLKSFDGFSGIFDGGGHTISNIYAFTNDDYQLGLFVNNTSPAIRNISIDGLTIEGYDPDEYPIYIGGLIGSRTGSNIEIDNVHITDFKLGRSTFHCPVVGGFFGSVGTATIRNSSVSYMTGQNIRSESYVRYLLPLQMGGIAGNASTLTLENVSINLGNTSFSATYSGMKCMFGGICCNRYSSVTLNATGVSVAGNATVSSNSAIYTGKVLVQNDIPLNSVDGVDVTGLIINGQ